MQAALFLAKAAPPQDIYSALAGELPDSQEDRPKEGVRVQIGKFGEGLLQVVVTPVRVDIFLNPPPFETQAGAPIGLPRITFGDFQSELDRFGEMIRRWLPRSEISSSRLALIAKALAPADTVEGAYEILKANLTSVRVEPGKMKDLMFRVNWRAATDLVQEGYLNRLTTWAATMVQLQLHTAASMQGPPSAARHFALREIDVNTPAEHAEELQSGDLVPIFEELLRVVTDTAAAGEHP